MHQNRQISVKTSELEDQYAIIFHIGDWRERGFWGRLFRKGLEFTGPEIQKMSKNELKWIEKGRFGVSGPPYESKLRSESIGMPTGPQSGYKKY